MVELCPLSNAFDSSPSKAAKDKKRVLRYGPSYKFLTNQITQTDYCRLMLRCGMSNALIDAPD